MEYETRTASDIRDAAKNESRGWRKNPSLGREEECGLCDRKRQDWRLHRAVHAGITCRRCTVLQSCTSACHSRAHVRDWEMRQGIRGSGGRRDREMRCKHRLLDDEAKRERETRESILCFQHKVPSRVSCILSSFPRRRRRRCLPHHPLLKDDAMSRS